jgi:hypothetical protein
MYSHLDVCRKEIRLLKIHPGAPEDPVETSLITVDLADLPHYEALSYVWGGVAGPFIVLVNGRTFPLQKGTFLAIHALRERNSERLIWVDALCINQNDMIERGTQVAIMGEIYERARSVVVYLGEATDKSDEAMRALQYLMDAQRVKDEPPWSHTTLIDVEHVLQDIFGRPWFKRIWTVQEASLAQHTTLLCGGHTVSWHGDLRSLRRTIFRIKMAAISPYFSITSGRRSKVDWSPLIDILETQMRQAARREGAALYQNQLDLAFQFRNRHSSDPRDNYFALFGLVENEKGGELKFCPDYTLSLEQVHLKYMREIERISGINDTGASPKLAES